MCFNCLIYDEACWLFCGYYDGGLRKRKLADQSINYTFPCHFWEQKTVFQMWRSDRNGTEGLCFPKTNTKMPTRTKNVEMNWIVTNSETHLHSCPCESRGFKIGRSSHRRCSIKKGALKNLQRWQEKTCVRVSLLLKMQVQGKRYQRRCFSVKFANFFLRTPFYRTSPGDCFWINLMVKKFNSAWLIFLNSQLDSHVVIHTNNSSCSAGVITIILM